MSRVQRSVLFASVVAIFAVVLLARSTAALVGEGQAPAPAPADVTPFVGDWLVAMSMQSFEVSLAVSVKTDGGKVSATISSAGQPTINVTDMSVVGNRLILKYMSEAMGSMISNVLTLTPDGQALRAHMAIMDGQYEMSGSGTKQAPGAPVRATGFGGGGRGAATSAATDFTPKTPYRPRTPEEEAAGFMLPTGYRMELVAADPDVISPTLIEFDGNGRMYVGEMISYMMDAERDARARSDQPHQPLGEHEGRRPLRQAHGLRRQARRAAHDPAARATASSSRARPTPTTSSS